MIRLCDWLTIPHGVTAVVGGGGKTSLIMRLAAELSDNGRVLLLTTTRIWPPACQLLLSPTERELQQAFRHEHLLVAGDLTAEGKLCWPSTLREPPDAYADYVLVEADGSRGLPLKAPDTHEPMLPNNTALTLAVAGMSCAGHSIAQAAHRPARYAALLSADEAEPVTPEGVASVLAHPNGQRKNVTGRFAVVLNQADTQARLTFARDVAQRLPFDAIITALQTRPRFAEFWRRGELISRDDAEQATDSFGEG